MESVLCPLVAAGYQIVGMTREARNADQLRAEGAEPVIADALDRDAVIEAISRTRAELVVHQLTALTGVRDFKNFDKEFAQTNRLRIEGTDNLLAGMRAAGIRRFIAQSYGSWNYERTGTEPKSEAAPLDPNPPRNQRRSLEAIRHLERKATDGSDIEGVALRYGNLYGPGTGFSADGDLVALVRKRGFPIVGNGAGVWSFIHVDDAASAVILAIQRGARGIYNIVDDEPAPVAVWLPELAGAVGARPPRRFPVWFGRLFVGEVGVSMMTQVRGASNAKAKRELGWKLRYPSWREGFRTGL